jgi:hypothetical protein
MNELVEIWKPVMGYEGLYEVSNLGRVRSLERIVQCGKGNIRVDRETIKTATPNRQGYLRINLYNHSKYQTRTIHRLVAEAFIPNPENKPQVDHINTDKTDNRVENLRWVDKQENQLNEITRNKMSVSRTGGKSTRHSNPAKLQFSKDNTFIRKWDNAREASTVVGCSRQVINDCCAGRCKSAGGYVWKHYEGFFLGDIAYTLKTRVA